MTKTFDDGAIFGIGKRFIGEIDLDGWHQIIENWNNAGGLRVIEEFNEQYQAFSN